MKSFILKMVVFLFSVVFSGGISALADDVTIHMGDNWQTIVNGNAAGTTYHIEAGVHRMQSVTPKNGDTFIGEYGAVMKGTKLLNSSSAVYDSQNNVWVFSGQTQDLLNDNQTIGTDRRCYAGNDLFVDGERQFHTNTRSEVDSPGEFYFDEAQDEIVMYDNPNGKIIETIVCGTAFNCNGKTNVTLENFTISQYGSNVRPGGAIKTDCNSYGLTMRYMELIYCHAGAVRLCAGSVVKNSRICYNGQIGFLTNGEYNGEQYPITIMDSEIAYNILLDGNWGISGEFGGCKIALTHNSIVKNCWFHENYFSCIWTDVGNDGVTICSNLIEGSANIQTDRGIYFEGSGYGGNPDSALSEIYWNTINIEYGGGIVIRVSSNVDVYQNAVTVLYGGWSATDNGQTGISRTSAGLLRDVRVFNNEFKVTCLYFALIMDYVGNYEYLTLCDHNKYIGSIMFQEHPDSDTTNNYSFSGWQALGYDTNGTLESSGQPQLPIGAVGFNYSYYGPRLKWRE